MVRIRLITIVLIVLLTLSAVHVFGFSDIAEGDPFAEDIYMLRELGYIEGYPDNTFRPLGNITRAEFVRITNNTFGFTNDISVSNMFNDVSEGSWYYNDVIISQAKGYIMGYPDGTFRPDGNITREEACAIVDRILMLDELISDDTIEQIKVGDDISPWARDSVLRVINDGFLPLDENHCFKATTDIIRRDVAYIYARVISKNNNEHDTDSYVHRDSEYDAMIVRTIASLKDIISDNVHDEHKLQRGDIASQKDFLSDLIKGMEAYLRGKEAYDMDTEAAEMEMRYRSMASTDRDELKRVILANVDVVDLYNLRSFFGF